MSPTAEIVVAALSGGGLSLVGRALFFRPQRDSLAVATAARANEAVLASLDRLGEELAESHREIASLRKELADAHREIAQLRTEVAGLRADRT